MHILLALLALGIAALGLSVLHSAATVFQEIEAFVVLLIAAMLFSGAAIVDVIANSRKKILRELAAISRHLSAQSSNTKEEVHRLQLLAPDSTSGGRDLD